MPQFNGLNIPCEIQTGYIEWMIRPNGSCRIPERFREGTCNGRGCSNCIYSRYNSERRAEYARHAYPEYFFEGLFTGGVEVQEEYGGFMLTSGSCGLCEDDCTGVACRNCIFSMDNYEARARYYQKHFPETKLCEVCGLVCYEEQCKEVNGYTVCPSCYGNHQICDDCGRPISSMSSNTVHRASGEVSHVCINCRSSYTSRNYSYCFECSEWFEESLMHRCENGSFVCHTCAESRYYPCNVCGTMIHATTSRQVCNNCNELRCDEIHCYSFKPSPIFNKLENEENPVYFGIELEVGDAWEGDRDDAVTDVCGIEQFYKYFYLKSDSSIPSYGFEIVTHPCTYKHHMEKFPWESILSTVSGYDLSGCGGCGMHVHISRNALTEYQWLLFDYFINRNQRLWEEISGRRGNHYTEYTGVRGAGLREYYGVCHYHDRYQAVNFCNSNTVEVRTFQSTTDVAVLKNRIKFCYALVEFIKAGKYNATQIIQKGDGRVWEEFIDFMNSL